MSPFSKLCRKGAGPCVFISLCLSWREMETVFSPHSAPLLFLVKPNLHKVFLYPLIFLKGHAILSQMLVSEKLNLAQMQPFHPGCVSASNEKRAGEGRRKVFGKAEESVAEIPAGSLHSGRSHTQLWIKGRNLREDERG